jgi:hypothetical protein
LKKTAWPLFTWISVLIAAGGVFLLSRTVAVLRVSNMDDPCSLVFKIAPSEPFAMFYTHSIYDAPVEEIFEASSGNIILKSVKTDSPAVMEYYGFEGIESLQDINVSLGPTFTVKVGMRQEQSLAVGERTIDLRTIANQGDRIRVSLGAVSLPRYFLSSMYQCRKIRISASHRGHTGRAERRIKG